MPFGIPKEERDGNCPKGFSLLWLLQEARKALKSLTRLSLAAQSGNGLRVKTQRVKTSEKFSEESNLPRRFR